MPVPRQRKAQVKALTPAELAALLEAARRTIWYAPLALMADAGLRRSEALGLWVEDVDLVNGVVRVRRGITEVPKAHAGFVNAGVGAGESGGIGYQEPKSENATRNVVIGSDTVAVLRSYREQIEAIQAALGFRLSERAMAKAPFFCDHSGRVMLPSSLSHAAKRIAKAAGIEGFTLHGLRHTAATTLLRAKVPAHLVSRRMGHHSAAFTQSVYAHALAGDDQDMAAVLEAIRQQGREAQQEQPARV